MIKKFLDMNINHYGAEYHNGNQAFPDGFDLSIMNFKTLKIRQWHIKPPNLFFFEQNQQCGSFPSLYSRQMQSTLYTEDIRLFTRQIIDMQNTQKLK